MTGDETFPCAKHPDVQTSLRCGKCEKPICPKCMVMTPVGARCKECADVRRLPTYRLSGADYVKGAGTALGMGIGVGLVWGLIEWMRPLYFFSVILSAGAGWLIAVAVGRSVNKKRGTWLSILAGLAVLLAYGIVFAIEAFRVGYLDLTLVRVGYSFLSAGVGVFIAVNKLR